VVGDVVVVAIAKGLLHKRNQINYQSNNTVMEPLISMEPFLIVCNLEKLLKPRLFYWETVELENQV